jgi:hypothetical protein
MVSFDRLWGIPGFMRTGPLFGRTEIDLPLRDMATMEGLDSIKSLIQRVEF